jgi:hypothetical protein
MPIAHLRPALAQRSTTHVEWCEFLNSWVSVLNDRRVEWSGPGGGQKERNQAHRCYTGQIHLALSLSLYVSSQGTYERTVSFPLGSEGHP